MAVYDLRWAPQQQQKKDERRMGGGNCESVERSKVQARSPVASTVSKARSRSREVVTLDEEPRISLRVSTIFDCMCVREACGVYKPCTETRQTFCVTGHVRIAARCPHLHRMRPTAGWRAVGDDRDQGKSRLLRPTLKHSQGVLNIGPRKQITALARAPARWRSPSRTWCILHARECLQS